MIFDGDCGFCRFWIERWRSWAGDQIEYVPYQHGSVVVRFPEIPVAQFETAVQFVERNGRVRRGADAVFQSLAGVWWLAWLSGLYASLSWFARFSEFAYRLVAGRRMFFSRINRLLFGRNPEPPRYDQTTRVLIRALGLIFFAAFISLWVQIHGLVGSQGILPAGQFMQSAGSYFDQTDFGAGRYWVLPTLGWIASGDLALHVYCLLGVLASLSVMAGLMPAIGLLGCWLFYLTLTNLGQDFLSYQWDILLLESGFLAILIVPWRRWLGGGRLFKPLLGILLVRWLLFRLMFESGAVKLASGDPVWRNLTALNYHFETQPLPSWISWYASQLPTGLLKTATAGMFVIELIVPFLFFAPRNLRILGCFATVGLQLAIILTGNYGCFNWLTIVLCLALLDDRTIRTLAGWLMRPKWIRKFAARLGYPVRVESVTAPKDACDVDSYEPLAPQPRIEGNARERIQRFVLIGYTCVVVLVGLAQLENAFGRRSGAGGSVTWLRKAIEPFRVVNPYGLFAVMTTSRPELVIEGSLDGVEWRPYVFKYKPGPLDRRPPIVPFHMPRLDWQMWFAALAEGRPPHWFGPFTERLFERSPAVLDLLATDPFPKQPPKYLRVLAYDYRFTNPRMRENKGQWWIALNRRYYVPLMTWQSPVKTNPPSASAGSAR